MKTRAALGPALRSCAMAWHVYLLRCGDGTLYAGATNDLSRRLAAHESGKGARYTRGRGPLVMEWSEEVPDRPAALRREHQIKRMNRSAKLRLVRVARPRRSKMR